MKRSNVENRYLHKEAKIEYGVSDEFPTRSIVKRGLKDSCSEINLAALRHATAKRHRKSKENDTMHSSRRAAGNTTSRETEKERTISNMKGRVSSRKQKKESRGETTEEQQRSGTNGRNKSQLLYMQYLRRCY